MAKIGGSSGGLTPKVGSNKPGGGPKDPFIGLEHSILGEGGTPQGHSWGVMTRAVTAGLGQSWFQDCSSVPLPEWVKQEAGKKFKPLGPTDVSGQYAAEVESMVGHLGWYEDAAVFPDLVRDSSELGAFTLLSQSSLAPKILRLLSERGIKGEEIPVLAIGSNVGEIGEPTMWLGAWATSFGTRTNIWFEIRTAEDGGESAYFYTNLAISTRVPEKWLSEVFAIPTQAAALLYTAETQFPTSIMTMPRSISWRDIPAEIIPTPFLTLERSGLCCVSLGSSADGTIQADFAGYPIVLTAGYLVPESSEEYFDAIIPTVIDTLTNLASIVEDGFRNYRHGRDPAFDHVLEAEYAMHVDVGEGISPGGHARWVPETYLGELVRLSRETYLKAYPMKSGAEQKALFEWVVSEGAGAVVGGAINSLVYSYLLPGREFERAEWLLKKAIAMEILDETSNARANLGQVYLAQGRRDDARDVLTVAAEDERDKFAVSEASYFLGLMAMEDGDRDEAQAHFTKGANQEADDDGTHRQLCREKLAQEFS